MPTELKPWQEWVMTGSCILGSACRCVSEPALCGNWRDGRPVRRFDETFSDETIVMDSLRAKRPPGVLKPTALDQRTRLAEIMRRHVQAEDAKLSDDALVRAVFARYERARGIPA